MDKKRIVVALGGNALGKTPTEQIEAVKLAADAIINLAAQGHDVIVGHGNGPQVGMINNAFSIGSTSDSSIPAMPLVECVAMSQGYIGYHLQQAIKDALHQREMVQGVVSLVTQIVVDPTDLAFQNPTKPIGVFYSEQEARQIATEKNWLFKEDSNRGFRRVVPSPQPKEIIELDTINTLVDNGLIVITVGGGGVPVIKDLQGLHGVDAVIDKDRSSALLARELGADILMILTAVDQVAINFGKPNQVALETLTIDEASHYLLEGQFGVGSMMPKVEACMDFVTNQPKGTAVITSLELAVQALQDGVGTKIVHDNSKINVKTRAKVYAV